MLARKLLKSLRSKFGKLLEKFIHVEGYTGINLLKRIMN